MQGQPPARAGLKEMKVARGYAETLLAIGPTYGDSDLAIGIENYVLSQKPMPLEGNSVRTAGGSSAEFALRRPR